MKIPEGLFTAKGKRAAGTVNFHGADGQCLREYGTTQDGIYATCLVLTAPGDLITGSFTFDPGLADHVDLVIDGIRRESSSSSGPDKTFSRIFKRACYQDKKNNKKGGLKSCAMEIQTRKSDKDLSWSGDGSPSSVGTVEVQLFRMVGATTSSTAPDSKENIFRDGLKDVERAPTFRGFSSWRDLNPYVDLGTPHPSLEIGFIERRQLAKFKAERAIKEWTEPYTLVACLKFKYCSAAYLARLGFKDIPPYFLSSSLVMPSKTSKKTSRTGTPEATTRAEEKHVMEKHADEDADSLFVEDQIQELSAEPGMSSDAHIKSETKQNIDSRPLDDTGIDKPLNFDQRQNNIPIMSQGVDLPEKIANTPEPERSILVNSDSRAMQRHPSEKFASTMVKDPYEYCLETDVETKQSHERYNDKYYDGSAGLSISKMTSGLHKAWEQDVIEQHRQALASTGFQNVDSRHPLPYPKKNNPEVDSLREIDGGLIEREIKRTGAQVKADSGSEMQPTLSHTGEIARTEITTLYDLDRAQNIIQPYQPYQPVAYQLEANRTPEASTVHTLKRTKLGSPLPPQVPTYMLADFPEKSNWRNSGDRTHSLSHESKSMEMTANKIESPHIGSKGPLPFGDEARFNSNEIENMWYKNPTSVPSSSVCMDPTNGDIALASASKKREADRFNYEGLNTSHRYSKSLESPPQKRYKVSEHELNAAQIRLTAAATRKHELKQALERVDISAKAKKLNEEAEEIERHNLALEAQLNSLYSERSST